MPLDLDDLNIPDKADGSSFFYGAECNAIRDAINKLNASVRELAEGSDVPVTAVNPTHRTGTSLPPNTLGVDADTYLNTVNGYFYQRKAGVYAFIMATKGADGKSAYQLWLDAGNSGSLQTFLNSLAGEDGDNGLDGDQWYRVFSKPANTYGQDGDFAFEAITLKTYRIYHKENGAWELIIDLSTEPASVVTPPTPTTYTATLQSYTATCGVDKPGTGASVTRTNATETSTVSQADANAKALAVAQAQALAALVCTVAPGNVLPTANAGSDATITLPTNSITLMGAGSDSDGSITGYQWRQVTGPNTATGLPATTQNVVASNLVAGSYQFGFRTTDNSGVLSAEDFVLVTVNPAPTTPTNPTSPNGPYVIHSEGDSLSALGADNWVNQMEAALAASGQQIVFKKYAVSGSSIRPSAGQMAHPDKIAQIKAGFVAGSVNILYLYAGINNIQEGQFPEETYEAYRALCAEYSDFGFKVVVFCSTSTRLQGDLVELYRRNRILWNLIRNGWKTEMKAVQLIDLQKNDKIGGYDAPLDTTYFFDKLHYTAAGAKEVTDMALAGLPFVRANALKVIVQGEIWDSVPQDHIVLTGQFVDEFERGADGRTENGWIGPDNYTNAGGDLVCVIPFLEPGHTRPEVVGDGQVDITFTYYGNTLAIPGMVLRQQATGGYVLWARPIAPGQVQLQLYVTIGANTAEFKNVVISGLKRFHQYRLRGTSKNYVMAGILYDQQGNELGRTADHYNDYYVDGKYGVWCAGQGARIHNFAFSPL